MATVLPAFNPIAGIPEAIQAFRSRQVQQQQQATRQQALQQLGQQLGVNIPPGINPQIAAQLLGGAQQNQFAAQAPQPGFTLGPGQGRFTATGQPIAAIPPAQPSPTQEIAQQRLNRIKQLQSIPEGQRTNAQSESLKRLIEGQSAVTVRVGDEKKITNTLGLRKEFNADPRIKDFRQIERQERNVRIALKSALDPRNKSKAAADQAIIKGFNLILEPGSVVRESEFAQTPAGISLINKLSAAIEKVFKGGVGITDKDRQEVADLSEQIFTGMKQSFNQAIDDFSITADEFGFNKRAIFGSAKKFDIDAQQASPLAGQLRQGEILVRDKATGQVGALPSGEFDPNTFERVQ